MIKSRHGSGATGSDLFHAEVPGSVGLDWKHLPLGHAALICHVQLSYSQVIPQCYSLVPREAVNAAATASGARGASSLRDTIGFACPWVDLSWITGPTSTITGQATSGDNPTNLWRDGS